MGGIILPFYESFRLKSYYQGDRIMDEEKIKILMKTMGDSFHGMSIPEHGKEALARYVIQHIKPGGFLTAVLQNDLVTAVGNADSKNIKNIPAYVSWLYNWAPISCWGSRINVKEWLESRGSKDD